MVVYCGWHRTAMDPNSSSRCLPISGEDTGLEALASPLVGYLGKVQGRADSLDCCPWCTSKGLTYALRSYRISLQDSITLCTNPQCLFPLVSRSLEDVLASLDPVEPAVGNKRKNTSTQENEELIKPSFKRLRLSELDSPGPQGVTGTHVSPAEHGAVNTITNGQHAELETDGEKQNGYHGDCQIAKPTNWELLQEKDLDRVVHADGFAPSVLAASAEHSSEVLLTTDGDEPAPSSLCGARDVSETELNHEMSPSGGQDPCSSPDSKQNINSNEIYVSSSPQSEQKTSSEISWTEDHKSTGGNNSESEDLSGSSLRELEELVPVPRQLLWRNIDNLCWLDSLLAALFNCKSLRRCKPKDEPQGPSLWQLLKRYEDICAAVRVHQQTGRDGIVRVPSHMLQKVTADLQILRMSVFKLLQPKLHCKLGQRETPVFAMPLLLLMDSWVEHLFRATFYWELKCSQCQTTTKERVMKTLPTFTNIVPDWHPLRAAHLGPCNVCCKENQTRTMMLENVPPVFVLHFVGGLPSNDVSMYTFNFKGRNYSISTVIQYKSHLKHFVTWTCSGDGSWLEYDDLKYPDCKTHRKLRVPANEMHVVFWEEEVCSPSTTCAVSPVSENEGSPSLSEESVADEVLACTPDKSLLLLPHNDTDIVGALTEDTSSVIDTTVTAAADATIGASTLLDTFEGLTHSDIVTLTLCEVKPDTETQSVTNAHKTEDLSAGSRNETLDSRPDSSSAAECSNDHDVELPSTSSDPESGNGSSSDPTYVPGPKRGRGKGIGKGKPARRGKAKKAVSPKESPHMSPPPSSEPCDVNSEQPADPVAQDKSPAAEIQQQSSAMSSTDDPPLSTNLNDLTESPVDQSARWSFLLSKYTHKVQKSTANIAPSSLTHVTPPPPLHSTPNPLRRQLLPAAFCPKPQLRTQESEELPVKAADMYGAFGAKSFNTQKPVLCPAVQSQTLTSKHLTNTVALSGTSLTVPGAKGLPKISPLKKLGSHSSEVPLGLSTTEALRYKLIKKLKAKKKKLARLNDMLGTRGELHRRPDSTDLHSPSTVTSSTYDGSTCDDFLSDLLSPATTASNLSPDSTGFLEMLANGQDGAEQPEVAVRAAGTTLETNGQNNEDFFSEFLSQVVTHTPTAMEAEVLSELELFI